MQFSNALILSLGFMIQSTLASPTPALTDVCSFAITDGSDSGANKAACAGINDPCVTANTDLAAATGCTSSGSKFSAVVTCASGADIEALVSQFSAAGLNCGSDA